MSETDKANELFNKFYMILFDSDSDKGEEVLVSILAKKCAEKAVEHEYHSLRELLFELRACKVIESEKVYLTRIDNLIKEEQEVKNEIQKL